MFMPMFTQFVSMGMIFIVTAMGMRVGMNMCMFVRMYCILVTMLMGVSMFVFMSMLKLNRILDHKPCTDQHNHQCSIKLNLRSFSKQKQAKGHP